MNNKFDEQARNVAQSVTPPAPPKKSGIGLAGRALACLGTVNKTGARIGWLIPLLGVVLVGGSYTAAKSYLGFEQTTDTGLEFSATLDRIHDACDLLRVQSQLQGGACPAAARRLDESLSISVKALDRELASSDQRTRAMLGVFFDYMARRQAQNPPMAASLPEAPSVAGMGTRNILTQTLASASHGK